MGNRNILLTVLAIALFSGGLAWALLIFSIDKNENKLTYGTGDDKESLLGEEFEENVLQNKDKRQETGIEIIPVIEESDTEDSIGSGGILPEGVKIPSLMAPIEFSGTYSEEVKKGITAQINEISDILKQDAGLFNQWVDLGLLRKSIGDYNGARDAWEYASALRPKNSLSFANLGVLYGYYLGDTKKSEENFLRSIKNNNKITNTYYQLADFYLEVLNNVEKAQNILEEGLSENPESRALEAALGAIKTNQ
jgi:tetratricopeptide (TPR) repeat protein